MTAIARRIRAKSRPGRPSALAVLFAHYVAGRIAEAQWAAISDGLDAVEASDRAALAAFYLEASASGEAVAPPDAAEAAELIAMVARA
jgi:hypothetical protein